MPSREEAIAQLELPATSPLDSHCTICHERLGDPVQVPCGNDHIFCRRCIVDWLEVGHTCPVCRAVLHDDFEEDSGEEEEDEDEEGFDEEEYRDGLLAFIDQINALSPREWRFDP